MSQPNYTVIVKNEFGQDGYALLFAQSIELQSNEWQSKFLFNNASGNFLWKEDYEIIWKQYGGQNDSQEIIPATLQSNNQVTLDYDAEDQAFRFKDQTNGMPESITVSASQNIPSETVKTGFTLAGYPVMMVSAQANMSYSFTPKLEYYVGFNTKNDLGVVVAETAIEPVRIIFPANIYSLTATIKSDGTWNIVNTPLRFV